MTRETKNMKKKEYDERKMDFDKENDNDNINNNVDDKTTQNDIIYIKWKFTYNPYCMIL